MRHRKAGFSGAFPVSIRPLSSEMPRSAPGSSNRLHQFNVDLQVVAAS